MIIIFEGPDGSGKTTLARATVELLAQVDLDRPALYMHASAPERHPLVEYTSPLRPGRNYVLDRWHLGEMIYGQLYRGKPGLTQEQFWAVEQYLYDMAAVLVHCNGSVVDLSRRIRERGLAEDHDLNVVGLRKEAEEFGKWTRSTWLPVLQSPIGMAPSPEEIIAFAQQQEKKIQCT